MKRVWKLLRFIVDKLLLVLCVLWRLLKRFIRWIHSRKRYAIPFYSLAAYTVFVVLLIKLSGDSGYKKTISNKRVNDVTAINPIHVGREIQPQTIEEIVKAIRESSGPISIGGGRFSMGGQTAYENSLHIDMREFNKVLHLDTIHKQVTVQSGIAWRSLQQVIDPYNLSIKIMQTYANFTVGGSISVNCHGRYIGHGPIVSSVLGIKLITASGEIVAASRNLNQGVFAAAIGGYGGIGVIAEVTLQLADNVKVERQVAEVSPIDYNSFFNSTIRNDSTVIFQNGDLYPPDFDLINSVAWRATEKALTDTVRVTPAGEKYWLEAQMMKIVSRGHFGKWMRRNMVDPYLYSDEKVVWRNREASYDVAELEPASREEDTYVLQEYFIPVRNINSFIPKMKAIYDRYDVNVINVSLRHAYADTLTYLSWAPEEVFAFVIYYKQGTDDASREEVKQWTVEMTDAILSENGRWYLPYQPHASTEQFKKGYPRAANYFDLKNKLDPQHRFTNKLLDKYNPYVEQAIEKQRAGIKGYYKDEAQSFLTVPEWYLVFNPKEYADFLEAGNDPSDFPFYRSIDEYWTLYDRSMKLVSEAYPYNDEYVTMLNVIGASITMEYAAKMIYENTVGRVFSWFSNGTLSDQEKVIIEAQRAYSDMIYDKAWYEFGFMPWVGKVWATSNTANSNWFRKVERMLFFTAEFAFKAVYAELIEWAAKANYEEPVTEIYLLTSVADSLQTSGLKVVYEQDDKKIVSIKRWGDFTRQILRIANRDIKIIEVAGNDEIVVSILGRKDTMPDVKAELLYTSEVVTDESRARYVYLLPVNELLVFVGEAKRKGFEIEHVFDY
ncbi:FAD-binding oxidoreductase [Parachryseolinea silvisoli]|uniref:FAD-binding oxidoreductase n=1 Tax=Parachryseolinea silvisoli TaxID=2873601 RepID=UPI002265EFC2|nr:FAD-dependent oxidoreductase [Parachryseolinea silvisoli]MCD9016616.1 FAD-dependent oxidoreductase [Parachryseolinea silvisoli]